MSGGKFANGAITGAFSRAFNCEMHEKEVSARQKERFGELVNSARSKNESAMKLVNSLGGSSYHGGESYGTYIYWDKENKFYSLSLTVGADLRGGNFVDPMGYKGSGNMLASPPHFSPNWAQRLGGASELVVKAYVVRQLDWRRDYSSIYQDWANRLEGPVYVDHHVGGNYEIFTPE